MCPAAVSRGLTGLRPLTHHNEDLVAKLDVAKAEGFTFKGADGDDVSGWLVKPPGFDAGKKYPVLFLIHGGPQGAWHDEWHARWNYQLFAAPGYASPLGAGISPDEKQSDIYALYLGQGGLGLTLPSKAPATSRDAGGNRFIPGITARPQTDNCAP